LSRILRKLTEFGSIGFLARFTNLILVFTTISPLVINKTHIPPDPVEMDIYKQGDKTCGAEICIESSGFM
jgi:hypothetical protein